MSLLILFFLGRVVDSLCFLLSRPLQKSPRLRRFKSDQDEIWQRCSSSKCASIDESDFKLSAIMSFRADKCCRLMSAHSTSTQHLATASDCS